MFFHKATAFKCHPFSNFVQVNLFKKHLFLHQLTHSMKKDCSSNCRFSTWSLECLVYINCSECQNKNKKQFVYTTCSELVVFMYWTRNSMNNLLSYCGLANARISTSDKDLPVQGGLKMYYVQHILKCFSPRQKLPF